MKPVFAPGLNLGSARSETQRQISSIDDFRETFQPHLEEFIDGKTESYANCIKDRQLVSILNYPRKLAAQGKRIRPYVAFLMYSALSNEGADNLDTNSKVMPMLVSLELFHLFCLVHDDIIDRGTERHSLPTLQRMVASELEVGNGLHNRDHIGNAQALLLGDILFAWAQESFHANRNFDAASHQTAQLYFNRMIDEVVLGEMLDVVMMTRLETSQESIEKKMLLKTAAYTFVRPMQLGAALAGTGRQHENYCSDLGCALGVAFQIQDDLLDIIGTPETTHKTLFADLRDHQHTYFTQYIFERGSRLEKAQLQRLLGADLKKADYATVLDLFESSGALRHGRERINRHFDQACLLVEDAPFRTMREPFHQLINDMRMRVPACMSDIRLEHKLVA